MKHARGSVPLPQLGKTLVYFSCLGLGFLFIEIVLIEKGAYFLGDRTIAFSLILCAMLVFSGLGSWVSGKDFTRAPGSLRFAAFGVGLWLLLSFSLLDGTLGAPAFLAASG